MTRSDLSPLPAGFLDQWALWYPDCPPEGYLLRDEYPDVWLRIHSLPRSKRYAESPGEYAELLSRHNQVATDLLGSDARCALLLRAIADEETQALLVELDRGQVYAPYDGGADLFFASTFERDLAKARYANWLSAREDGM
jgi:hypothetical protein